MGILYVCDRQQDIIYIVWDGKVTGDDWLNHAAKLLAEPDWSHISHMITDARTAFDTASIGDKEIKAAAVLFAAHAETLVKKKVAIVANDLFGRAIKLEAQVSRLGVSVVVFNSVDTACIFLNIDPTDARQRLEQLSTSLRGAA